MTLTTQLRMATLGRADTVSIDDITLVEASIQNPDRAAHHTWLLFRKQGKASINQLLLAGDAMAL
ncbi:MAG: hypothetical protein AB8B63_23105 [Granulosicoccus sp.]